MPDRDRSDEPPIRCTTCGADWSAGAHSTDCVECGGGALTTPCPYCDGYCGATWRRAVLDSQDAGEAHWLGQCDVTCGTCGAAWPRHRHTPDCAECGGGGLLRVCPDCAGRCGTARRRRVAESRATGRAVWDGVCGDA